MHEFLRRIQTAFDSGAITDDLFKEGVISRITVAHDPHCGIYSNEECNCDPDITIDTGSTYISINEDGTIKETKHENRS